MFSNTQNNRGVSPIISVVIMIAIAVIAATVVSSTVLDQTSDVGEETPQASFTYEYDAAGDSGNGLVTIQHNGGDDLSRGDGTVKIAVEGGESIATDVSNTLVGVGSEVDIGASSDSGAYGDPDSDGKFDKGDEVRIYYVTNGGEDGKILGTYTIPEDA